MKPAGWPTDMAVLSLLLCGLPFAVRCAWQFEYAICGWYCHNRVAHGLPLFVFQHHFVPPPLALIPIRYTLDQQHQQFVTGCACGEIRKRICRSRWHACTGYIMYLSLALGDPRERLWSALTSFGEVTSAWPLQNCSTHMRAQTTTKMCARQHTSFHGGGGGLGGECAGFLCVRAR